MSDTTAARTVAPVRYPMLGSPSSAAEESRAEVRGHAAGYAAGLRAADAVAAERRAALEAEHVARSRELESRVAASIAALHAATDALRARVAPVLAEADDTLVEAALQLAEAVVGHAIRASRPSADPVPDAASGPVDPDGPGLEGRHASGAHATVLRALASVDPGVAITVRTSPADAAALAGVDLPVPVVADPALRDGDAVVDLPHGVLDARIGTALDRARTALGAAPAAAAAAAAVRVVGA